MAPVGTAEVIGNAPPVPVPVPDMDEPIEAPVQEQPPPEEAPAQPKRRTTVMELNRQLRELRARNDELARTVTEWEERWRRCWDRLGREAEQRGWCSDYDDICAELDGLPRRVQRNIIATAVVTTHLNLDLLRSTLGIPRRASWSMIGNDTPTVQWNVEVSQNIRAAPDTCVCSEVDGPGLVQQWINTAGIVGHPTVGDVALSCGYC